MDDGKAKKSCVPFLRQCFVSAGVCLNILGHGAVIGFSAILIPALRRPESHIHTNTTQESSIASVIGIALLAGNFIMTPLMSTQGRKVCHILAVLPILAGWFVLLLADSVAALVFARFLQGISMGMMGPLGSVIIAETTHPDNRGAFLSTISLSLSIGAFFCHTVGAYLSWQQTALVMSFIPFTSLLLIICAPESPSWLISKGRYAEASSIFYWLRGRGPTEDEELESMITAQNMVKKSSIAGQKVSIRVKIARLFRYINVTFRKPEFYKPITIMLFTFTMFQFSGLNVFNSYALDIIRQVVGPEANAEMLVVAIDLARIVCNFVIIYLTRKFNRRTVLIISGFSCVTCYLTKAVYMYAKVNGKLPEAIAGQWFPTTLLIVYIGLTLGLAVLPFTIGGEVFPLAYRGLAGGISGIPLSVSYFVAVKSFPILNVNIGLSFTYLVYGSIVLVCLIVLCFILPETKGRTLQEIENSFKGLKQTDGTVTQPFMSKYDVDMRRKSSIIIPY